MTQPIDKNKETTDNIYSPKVKDKEYTTLKFTVEITYNLPSDFNVNIDKMELTQLDLGLGLDSNFQLKITKAYLRSDEKQRMLFVTFETEGIIPESPEVIQGKIDSLEKRLLEKFREIGEYFVLLLQLKYSLPPLILTDVKISSIQIDDNMHKYIIVKDEVKVFESVSLTIEPQLKPNDLRDLVKNLPNLAKLDEKSKELLNLLKRIVKWYYYALDESDEIDKFIDYLMIFEIWKLYKAHKNNDEKCIPTEKHNIPHKKCLSKGIYCLCEDKFYKWKIEFDDFYEVRNKVIHEGLREVALKYLSVASECANKIIEELRKEIQGFLR